MQRCQTNNKFNLSKYISDSVTFWAEAMFAEGIRATIEKHPQEIKGKSVCVIGGTGGKNNRERMSA